MSMCLSSKTAFAQRFRWPVGGGVLFALSLLGCDSQPESSPADTGQAHDGADGGGADGGPDLDASDETGGSAEQALLRERALAAGLLPLEPVETGATADMVELGRLLFFDPILGGEEDVSCATCHHPMLGFADNTALSIGVAGEGFGAERHYPEGARERPLGDLQPMGRHTPTALNMAGIVQDAQRRGVDPAFTWDGRIATIDMFAVTPLRTRDEMRGDAFPALDTNTVLAQRLDQNSAWKEAFFGVFAEAYTGPVEHRHLQEALRAYMLTLQSPPTAYDAFLEGEDTDNELFLQGLELFLEMDCVRCHNGPLLSDLGFHRTGVTQAPLSRPHNGGTDVGREEATLRERDRFRFRTAPLREVIHTAPYMHSGELADLDAVFDFYASEENFITDVAPDLTMEDFDRGDARELEDDEREALKEFMRLLSSPEGWIEDTYAVPESVPSGLEVAGPWQNGE